MKNRFFRVGIVEGKMDPLGASASLPLSSLWTDPNRFRASNEGLAVGVAKSPSSGAPTSLRKFPSSAAQFSGNVAKNASTKLSTLALGRPDELDVADASVVVSWVLTMRGGRGGWLGGRIEGVVGTLLIVELGSLGFFGKHNGGAVGRNYSVENYGTPSNKVSLQTKLGAGNTMVMSELKGGVDMMGLLVFQID